MQKILFRTGVVLVIILICSTEFIPNSNKGFNVSKERFTENINKSSTDSNYLHVFLRSYNNKSNRQSYRKANIRNPIIPDEATAIEIANLLFRMRFSAGKLNLGAVLIENNSVWRVAEYTPPGINGGKFYILEIRKIDGKVLYINNLGK